MAADDRTRDAPAATGGDRPAAPTTEAEWTIHALNIHGTFFERWCEQTVAASPWRITATRYPVEFPRRNGPLRGNESELDIRAERVCGGDGSRLDLLLECKKNNPELVNWVFFPRPPVPPAAAVYDMLRTKPREGGPGWDVLAFFLPASFKPPRMRMYLCDEGRETRGDYVRQRKKDWTRTANKSITDAAYQVALATQAIVEQETLFARTQGSAERPPECPWVKKVIVPAIVTSAKLFVCEFDPAHVDPASGELPLGAATLNPVPWLLYDYPLPPHLQATPADWGHVLERDHWEHYWRKQILVVTSAELGPFLRGLADAAPTLLG